MQLFKIDSTEAVKGSKYDASIEELIQAFEKDGTNVLPFKEDNVCAATAQRITKAYAKTLDDMGVKVRVLQVRRGAHPEIFAEGYVKMIVLAKTEDSEEEEKEEKPKSNNPFGEDSPI